MFEERFGRDAEAVRDLTGGFPVLHEVAITQNSGRRCLALFRGLGCELQNLPFMNHGVPAQSIEGQDCWGGDTEPIGNAGNTVA